MSWIGYIVFGTFFASLFARFIVKRQQKNALLKELTEKRNKLKTELSYLNDPSYSKRVSKITKDIDDLHKQLEEIARKYKQ